MTKPKPVGGFCSTELTAARAPGLCYITTGALGSLSAINVMGQAPTSDGCIAHASAGGGGHDDNKGRPVIWTCLMDRCAVWDVTIMTARLRQLAASRQRTREGKCEIVAAGPPNGRARLAACIRPACCTTTWVGSR